MGESPRSRGACARTARRALPRPPPQNAGRGPALLGQPPDRSFLLLFSDVRDKRPYWAIVTRVTSVLPGVV